MKVSTVPVGEAGPVEQPPSSSKRRDALGCRAQRTGRSRSGCDLYLEGSEFAGLLNNTAPDRMTVQSNRKASTAPQRRAEQSHADGHLGGLRRAVVPQLVFQKEDQITRDVTVRIAEMICGRVIGPNNEGVPDANVIAVGVSATQQSARGQTKTNEKGEFCFEHLKPGDYNVIAAAKGYRSTPGRGNRVGTNTSNLVIEMFKETPCAAPSSTDRPANRSSYVRMRFWYGGGSPSAPSGPGDLRSEQRGRRYCIQGVPSSDYVVEAFAPGYAPTFSRTSTCNRASPCRGS
jgi:hypothetical protein